MPSHLIELSDWETFMQKVEVYTKFMCPYCSRALALLRSKGATITEYDATLDSVMKQEMIGRASGGATFPQIFINGTHIGGSDDLAALDRAGGLDPLLSAR